MTGEERAAYATDEMKRAGVGFREHTGWAAMVALGGGVTAPVVLARNRYELSEGDLPRAVYHAARQLDLENAGRLVRQVEVVAGTAAERQLRRTVAELEAGGYEVVGAAVAAPRELPAPCPRSSARTRSSTPPRGSCIGTRSPRRPSCSASR
jgi:hypothetical protein